MCAIAIVCCALGGFIHRVQVQRTTVATIERAGGTVMYDWQWQWKKGRPIPTGMNPRLALLFEPIGVDYFFDVTYVDLKYRGSDDLLEEIGQFRRLEYLCLAGSPVTDAGVANLQGLTSLKWLSLDDTKISDRGLERLKGLDQLHTLSLGLTSVSDEGLPHLKALTGLKRLSLHLTMVSDNAGHGLARAMPGTFIAATGWPGRNEGARSSLARRR